MTSHKECRMRADASPMRARRQNGRRHLFCFAALCLLLTTCAFTIRAVEAFTPPVSSGQAGSQATHEITILEADKPLVREITGGQEHSYQITLAQGQYAKIIVEQRGIDVIAWLLKVVKDITGAFDKELRSQGEEEIALVAETAGSFTIIVEPSSNRAPTGSYAIRVAEIRAATENDRLLYEACQLKFASDQADADGQYDEVRRCLDRALTISEQVVGKEDRFLITLLLDLAEYYDDRQDFVKALAYAERAFAIAEKVLGAEHPQTLMVINKLAWLNNQMNDIVKAERLAQRSVEVAQRTLGPEHQFVADCLHTRSQTINDLKQKEQMLLQALAIADKAYGEQHPTYQAILIDLGVVYTDQGDYQQAEHFLLRAQAVFEQFKKPGNLTQVILLNNLGRIARERKDYVKAEENYRQARTIVEKAFGADNPRLAIILNNLANIYRAKGEYAKSLDAHLRVLRISEVRRGPYHPLTLLSLGNIAKTYAAQGSLAEAIKYQARADAVIERNIAMNLAIGSERQKLSYLNSVAERTDRTISLSANLAPQNETASALAALVLLQRKGRLLDAMSASFASLRQRASAEEQRLLEQYNETSGQLARLVLNGPQKLALEEHQNRVRELEARKEQLEADISRRSAEFRAAAQPVTLAAVQTAIPADAALIEFAIYRPFDPKAESNSEAYGEPHYIAYVLRQTGEVRWRDLGDMRTLDQSIDALRQTLGDPRRREVRDRARAVDAVVMQPLRPLLGDAKQLLISPDGALNLIPFEALADEQGRYLIQRYSFAYLTTGRDLLRMQVERAGQQTSTIIADPAFGEPASANAIESAELGRRSSAALRASVTNATDLSNVYFAPLANTIREARAIQSLFPDSQVLTGQQATEQSLKRSVAPRVLHIATHGFFLTDTPPTGEVRGTRAINARAKIENPLLRSGLALAGANVQKQSGEDGILTALEASGLNLWGTKLVTLSACDTGLGEVKNGEGVYGLRRAFVLAGAETLVMSLWPVSDYVTHELMISYYQNLKLGRGRGAALRQVQLSMLKRKGREHPFYWASFIQAGEWASLDGKR